MIDHSMAKDITIHMMVRNEAPTCFYALRSLLPFVGKAIVADTGSTDKTVALLKTAMNGHAHKVDFWQETLPDSTGWRFGKYTEQNKYLSDLRQKMIDETRTKFIWILDGDEVYREITVEQCLDVFQNWPRMKRVAYVPLLWFGKDIYHLVQSNPPTYNITGRLFVREGLALKGTFPGEMHCYQDMILGPETRYALLCRHIEPFHHYEMTMKPWRRRTLANLPYGGPQPEVFYEFARKQMMRDAKKPAQRRPMKRAAPIAVGAEMAVANEA